MAKQPQRFSIVSPRVSAHETRPTPFQRFVDAVCASIDATFARDEQRRTSRAPATRPMVRGYWL